MLYPKIFDNLERARWNLYSDIPWHEFDSRKISDRQLHGIKMNAILEWSSMPTTEMFLRDNPHDGDFCAFVSIWFYEEQKHSLALLEYLRRFAPEYLPSEAELAAVRFNFDPAPALDSLALHFCGEVRLNQWYKCARAYHTEPVIKTIYEILSNDEARHARSYYEYMRRALSSNTTVAQDSFSKIGVLMTNPRINKAMHPTNLHVSKELYPADTVNGRLPDPEWLTTWLNKEIDFNEEWELRVEEGILRNYSALFGESFTNPKSLRKYRNDKTVKKN